MTGLFSEPVIILTFINVFLGPKLNEVFWFYVGRAMSYGSAGNSITFEVLSNMYLNCIIFQEFNLIERRELAPLQELIEKLTAKEARWVLSPVTYIRINDEPRLRPDCTRIFIYFILLKYTRNIYMYIQSSEWGFTFFSASSHRGWIIFQSFGHNVSIYSINTRQLFI